MRRLHPELPSDARTLMQTPSHCPAEIINGGKSGAANGHLQRYDEVPSGVRLQIHMDGMSVFRSSRLQLWPIVARLISPKSDIFVVGLYCGYPKPLDGCV